MYSVVYLFLIKIHRVKDKKTGVQSMLFAQKVLQKFHKHNVTLQGTSI